MSKQLLQQEIQQTIAALETELAAIRQTGNDSVFIIMAGASALQFVMKDHKPVSAKPCELHLATRFILQDAEMIAAALASHPARHISVADVRQALSALIAAKRATHFELVHGVAVITLQSRNSH